jgi:hypothetical protein
MERSPALRSRGLEFGERLLDRIEVSRIGRQVEQLRARRFDGLAHAGHSLDSQKWKPL